MKTQPKIISRILEGLKASQTICVVGHIRPDGDCIGSQLGLTLALQNEGKKVLCWNQDPLPHKLAFLDPKKLFQTPAPGQRFDCVVATDSASLERLGTVRVLDGFDIDSGSLLLNQGNLNCETTSTISCTVAPSTLENIGSGPVNVNFTPSTGSGTFNVVALQSVSPASGTSLNAGVTTTYTLTILCAGPGSDTLNLAITAA